MNSVKKFIEKLNMNAPIISNTEIGKLKYKYPYKPALLISIITSIEIDDLFNKEIEIDKNAKLIKLYYDLLMNAEVLSTFLIQHKSKIQWSLGFNENIKTSIINNIFDMPAKKLADKSNDFWVCDYKNHSIRINYDFSSDDEKEKLKNTLLNEAFECLKNCIPEYENLNLNEVLDYNEWMVQTLLTHGENDWNKVQSRRYQHLFRKQIIDRDLKCIICCIDSPNLLEACHIQPHCCCHNAIDKYNTNNGITLCRNHHKLFDDGLFSFDNKWKVITSSQFNSNDANILIKTFEPCFIKLKDKYYFDNIYVEYHRNNIFIA